MPTEMILGGVIVASFTGLLGYIVGGKKKITDVVCKERQLSCNSLVRSELTHIKENQKKTDGKVDEILKIITNKFLSI